MPEQFKKIYADAASTTRVSDAVLAAMQPFFQTEYGNPSSEHALGFRAKEAVTRARETIAAQLRCGADELYFTSGGTESDCWAIIGSALATTKKHLIVSAIEHPAVLNCCKMLERFGYRVSYAGADADGRISVRDIEAHICGDTFLIIAMTANNETGVIQPIDEISELSHRHDIPLFSDGVQAVGSVPIDLSLQKVDLFSISGHKICGPKGIGLLYVSRRCGIAPIIYGGGQEKGLRSGTENVAGIVGLAAAIQQAVSHSDKNAVREMRALLHGCISRIPYAAINGDRSPTLPGVISACFDYVEGSDLVRYLSEYGIYASSSSACSTNSVDPSHVLLAMGVPYSRARGALRLSINESNTLQEIECICEILPLAVQRLRSQDPEYIRLSRGGSALPEKQLTKENTAE